MKSLLKLIILFLLTVTFSGCVKILTDDLKAEKTKLVINSVISPDSVFTVNVSKTANIFDEETLDNLPFINDAEVKVFENGNFLFNLDSKDNGYYRKDYYPLPGKKYTVEVYHKDFDPVTSGAVIPGVVKVKKFDTISLEQIDQYTSALKSGFLFDDPPGEDNYYMLQGEITYLDDSGAFYNTFLDFRVPDVDENLYAVSNGDKLLWSDKLIDGHEIKIEFYFFDGYIETGKMLKSIKDGNAIFKFYFSNISKDYFLYLKTERLYYETANTDPFMEPVIIHSNVKNGYGIFGAMNTDTTNISYDFNGKKFFGKGGGK